MLSDIDDLLSIEGEEMYQSRPKKRPRLSDASSDQSFLSNSESSIIVDPIEDDITQTSDVSVLLSSSPATDSDQFPGLLYQHMTDHEFDPDSSSSISQSNYTYQHLEFGLTKSLATDVHLVKPSFALGDNASQPLRSTLTASLPSFIAPLPAGLDDNDIAYLSIKEAFHTPGIRLRDQLLRKYVYHIHPYLPLLDLAEFLGAVSGDGDTQVDLLLYQAVMFAALPFVDIQYLQAEGFASRRAAREVFYRRTKLLYDLECGQQPLSSLQTLLLLTYWTDDRGGLKDARHWCGLSVSLARNLGLEWGVADPIKSPNLDPLRKRLWWSCFMRDQLLALGMGRHPLVLLDRGVPLMLSVGDFEQGPLSQGACDLLGSRTFNDPSFRHLLARTTLHMTKLCVCINHVLRTQYLISCPEGRELQGTINLVPKAGNYEEVLKVERELDILREEHLRLFSSLHLDGTFSKTPEQKECILPVGSLLEMLRLSISSTLHRPYMCESWSLMHPEMAMLSGRKSSEAAIKICIILQRLAEQDAIRYLPSTGVTVVLPAVTFYLRELRRDPGRYVQKYHAQIDSCRKALDELQTMYATAEFGHLFLETAAKKLNVQVPCTPHRDDHVDTDHPDPLEQVQCMIQQTPSITIDWLADVVAQVLPAESLHPQDSIARTVRSERSINKAASSNKIPERVLNTGGKSTVRLPEATGRAGKSPCQLDDEDSVILSKDLDWSHWFPNGLQVEQQDPEKARGVRSPDPALSPVGYKGLSGDLELDLGIMEG